MGGISIWIEVELGASWSTSDATLSSFPNDETLAGDTGSNGPTRRDLPWRKVSTRIFSAVSVESLTNWQAVGLLNELMGNLGFKSEFLFWMTSLALGPLASWVDKTLNCEVVLLDNEVPTCKTWKRSAINHLVNLINNVNIKQKLGHSVGNFIRCIIKNNENLPSFLLILASSANSKCYCNTTSIRVLKAPQEKHCRSRSPPGFHHCVCLSDNLVNIKIPYW